MHPVHAVGPKVRLPVPSVLKVPTMVPKEYLVKFQPRCKVTLFENADREHGGLLQNWES